jgi:reductive dehalogenase
MAGTEIDKTKKINRRQFFQTSAAGSIMGATALTANKGKLCADIVRNSVIQEREDFPVVITDKCKRMHQRDTIFCRQLWDHDLVKKVMAIEEAAKPKPAKPAKGWTHLDQALNAAGWAVDNKFAAGSENGQPHSQAYVWDEPAQRRRVEFKDPGDAAKKAKKAASFLGASLVGITRYDPLWTYSHLLKEKMGEDASNKGPPQFDIIPPDFPFKPKSVVVIAVEMDYKTIALSPSSLEGASTGLGYSHMASVGYSVATFLRELGYRSFACGNDVSLSVPYAVAAGLGELGRNGLLITRKFGPRVRLVKVFTELEIKPDRPKTFGVWDFCKSCRRCAESCPSGAISFDKPTLKGETISNNPGVLKWYINPEKCIEFWIENGSDCANCITVCPYNKPDMWHHELSAAATALPVASLHVLMAKMDKAFGFGKIQGEKANAAFWDAE